MGGLSTSARPLGITLIMSNKLSNKWLHYGMLSFFYATAAATFLSHGVMHALPALRGEKPAVTTHCEAIGQSIQVSIERDTFVPAAVQANQCDRLEIINRDSRTHQPIFGEHQRHEPYPGFQDRALEPGSRSNSILTQTGQYELHDHYNENNRLFLTIR